MEDQERDAERHRQWAAGGPQVNARRAIGIFVELFGIVMLVIGVWFARWALLADEATIRRSLAMLIVGTSAALLSFVGLFGTWRWFAIVKAIFALAVVALTCAMVPTEVAPGPGAITTLAAAMLLVIGALASAEASLEPSKASWSVDQGDGRRFIYRGGKVVEIQRWADGKLVSTEPFAPKIAGHDGGGRADEA